MTPDPSAQLVRIQQFFETLTPQSLAHIDTIYAQQARFVDPFNAVQGVAAIAHIFAHMFATLRQPRFVVTTCVQQGAQCFLSWEFRFYFKGYRSGQEQVILGASHLVLDAQGCIALHRDYWDAAQELYEKLPVLGGLMRWLRARFRAR